MEVPLSCTCTGRFEERDFLFLTSVITGDQSDQSFRRFVLEREDKEILIVQWFHETRHIWKRAGGARHLRGPQPKGGEGSGGVAM